MRAKSPGPGTQASAADRYDLYQRSVQAPEADIELMASIFEGSRGRPPMTLREDFAGTAYLSSTWVASDPERRALAVDRDPVPLEWGARHNLSDPAIEQRVELRVGEVRAPSEPPVDLIYAGNFSVCCLHRRSELIEYLGATRRSLVSDGALVVELYGGTEAIVATLEERSYDDFDYVWEQRSFNPIDHRTLCSIHFDFPDGSRLEDAFVYDFRLWSIPELVDAMRETGYAESRIYWEAVDDNGDGTGEYRETTDEENQEGWLVYVVGLA